MSVTEFRAKDPAGGIKFQEMAGDVTESYEWSATPRVMALKRMRFDTLAVLCMSSGRDTRVGQN